jgi:hypothetical protein
VIGGNLDLEGPGWASGVHLPGIRVDGVRTLGKRRGSLVNMIELMDLFTLAGGFVSREGEEVGQFRLRQSVDW